MITGCIVWRYNTFRMIFDFHFFSFKHFLFDSKLWFIGVKGKRILYKAWQIHGVVETLKINRTEGIDSKARQVRLEVESQTSWRSVHLTTKIASETSKSMSEITQWWSVEAEYQLTCMVSRRCEIWCGSDSD